MDNNPFGQNSYDDSVDDYGGNQVSQPELGRTVPPPPPPPGPSGSQGNTGAMNVDAISSQSLKNDSGWFAKLPIPLSIVTSVTAIWLITGSILDVLLTGPALADFIIDCYFVFFGLSLLLIMMPTAFGFMNFLEHPRSGVEKWTRFIATNWGQGYFMLFVCILAFGRTNFFRISVGIVLVLTGILSIWCGRLAAKKYNRLREYLGAGNEGDALVRSIEDKSRYVLVDGLISEDGIRSLVERAGRSVTRSEVHTIFCFFDRDRIGKVEMKQFVETLVEVERVKSL